MRICLICPSNMLYMPYVENYIKILNEINIDYTIINWDRFKIEDESEFSYRDSKVGHQRNFFDYLNYARFVIKLLKKNNYDKIVIFGIQLVFYLRQYLIKNYSNKYIIDIRDYNKILKFFSIESAIKNSFFTTISSPGYEEWLPISEKYLINHNFNINKLNFLEESKDNIIDIYPIVISYIGTITNLKINIELINSVSNDKNFLLYFVGEGLINNKLSEYIKLNSINNVIVKGRYTRDMEEELYKSSNLINMVLYGDSINNRTCLSNRLYKGAYYGRPLISLEGTLISNVVKDNNLGIVIKSFDNFKDNLQNHIKTFDIDSFNIGRKNFITKVISDNMKFENKLKKFLELL